jgi:hypothetical protein
MMTKSYGQNNNIQGTWNGTVRYTEKYKGLTGHSERTIDLTIKANKVTGSNIYDAETIIDGKTLDKTHCADTADGILHTVNIRTFDGTYDIGIEAPINIKCDDPEHHSNAGSSGNDLQITDKKLEIKNGKYNLEVLTGNETRVADMAGMGKVTYTTSWRLVSDLDVELIVKPKGFDKDKIPKLYEDWLPEPGKDETTKGSYMRIELELKSKSGKPLKYKAQSFELKLSNTSAEPGITINYPVNSNPQKQLPDLRFIPLPIAESDAQDQYITVSCRNGSTGEAYIASYDGGGATTLTAEATLGGGISITGHLAGSSDDSIQIPKRVQGTMIATSWLNANGNPKEIDDRETSKDNSNGGDGLSAYEEYRGVISEGKYKKLDPQNKELGILATQQDFKLFDEGISWFKNASDLKAIRFDFDKDEIAPDGKLNSNAKTARVFDQHAVYILNGGLGGGNDLGSTYSKSDKPDIPAQIISVVIDWANIQKRYQKRVNAAKPAALKFTVQDYLSQTVAHELGHTVSIYHHGRDRSIDDQIVKKLSDRIFDYDNNEINIRPYPIETIGEKDSTVESGDMSCMMNYYPFYHWGYQLVAGSGYIFSQVPYLPLGKSFCTSEKGTGINATAFYFGKAMKGNCMRMIKLK